MIELLYRLAFALRRPLLAGAGLLRRLCAGGRRAFLFLHLGFRPVGDISHDLQVKHPENLRLGVRTKIGPECTIGCYAPVSIGDDVTLSQGVIIESAGLDFRAEVRRHSGRPISIGNGAWLGARCIILAGVSIGERSVVAAGEIVRFDVPDNHVFVKGEPRAMHAASPDNQSVKAT